MKKGKPVFHSRTWCEEHIIELKHCPCPKGEAERRRLQRKARKS